MKTVIIKKQRDIKDLGLEDNYIIDVYPDSSEEDQFITEKMQSTASKLNDSVIKHIEKIKRPRKKKRK